MAKGNFVSQMFVSYLITSIQNKGEEKEWCDMVTFYVWTNREKNTVVQQTKLSNLFPLIFKLF